MKKTIPILSICFILLNCAPPEPIIIEVPVEKEDKLTLGTVQSKIKKGMNQTEVLNTQNERIEMRGGSMRIKCNSNGLTLQDVEFGIRSFFKKKMNFFFVT